MSPPPPLVSPPPPPVTSPPPPPPPQPVTPRPPPPPPSTCLTFSVCTTLLSRILPIPGLNSVCCSSVIARPPTEAARCMCANGRATFPQITPSILTFRMRSVIASCGVPNANNFSCN
ncbi:hypothetical protein VNO80_29192 [Phaseolus coccineus]|uniref:Hydrophobic seed protein domain-containing protein n=1 Tax=Phaseolus coccineus TaxID=3886 RepID=A0AAN9LAG7_PHACN